jgi:hypothetical protein
LKPKPWPSLIKPSTLEFVRQARQTRGFSAWDWLHGYVYARWPYLYISVGTGEHWLAKLLGPPVGFVTRLIPKSPPNGKTLSMDLQTATTERSSPWLPPVNW